MQITSPVLRSFCLLATLSLSAGPLAGQGRTFPIEAIQSRSEDTPGLPITTQHLTGTVVNSIDGAPVARALVTSSDRRFATFTDSQGRFSFDLRASVAPVSGQTLSNYPSSPAAAAPSALFVSFTVRKPGFTNGGRSFALPPVQSSTPAPPLTLKLVPTAVITGHVYADSGDLPQRLIVQLLRKQVIGGKAEWSSVGGAIPSSRGEFRLASLDPGDYKLLIPAYLSSNISSQADSIPGVPPVFYPNTATEDSAAVLALAAGASVAADFRIRIAPFYHVTIPFNAPLKNGVSPAFLLNAPPGLRLQADNQSYAGYLPDGAYDVLLTSVEQRTPNDPNPQFSEAVIKVEVHGKPIRTDPASLHPLHEIPVIIRREFTSGQPHPTQLGHQPSVILSLHPLRQNGSEPPEPAMKPNTGDEGLSVVTPFPGVYTVDISPTISPAYVASATSGTTDLLREPLQILANGDPRPIEITLRDDLASIDANLTLDPATPPPSYTAPVVLICIPLDRPQSAPVYAPARQSQVAVSNLAPGRYLLIATRSLQILHFLEYTDPEVLNRLMQKGTVVTLSASQKATVQVPLMPDGDN